MEKMKLNIQLFAVSGSISCSQIGNYNITDNTTTERITFTVTRTSGTTYWTSAQTVRFTIDGRSYTSSLALPSSQSSASCYVDVTVTHDSDGSKYLEFSASIETGTSSGTVTTSGSKWLTKIPRGSIPTLSSSSVTVGSSVTIYTNRASSSFTHELFYIPPNSSSDISLASGVGESYQWTVPTSLLNYFKNSSSGLFSIRCNTYNNGTYVGTATVNLTVSARLSDIPTYTLSIADTNSKVISSGIGSFVQNLSAIEIKLSNIQLCFGSPLDYCYAAIYDSNSNKVWDITQTLDGDTFSTVYLYTPALTREGTFRLTTDLYDKRGTAVSRQSTTYTSIAYTPPTITNVAAVRSNSSGTESEDGTYLKYTFQASITSLNNKNTKKFEIGYKRNDLSGNYTFREISSSSYTINQTAVLSGVTLSTNYVWDICFRATDTFGNTIVERELGTDFKLINFNSSGKSMAFGTISNRGSSETVLDSNLTINCMKGLKINDKDLLLDILYPVGSIYMSMNSTSPETLFGGKWTQIINKFILLTNESRTTGGSDTTGSHTLTIDEMPSHVHEGVLSGGSSHSESKITHGDWTWSSTYQTSGSIMMPAGGDRGHTHPQNFPPYITAYAWYRTS